MLITRMSEGKLEGLGPARVSELNAQDSPQLEGGEIPSFATFRTIRSLHNHIAAAMNSYGFGKEL